MSSASGPEAMCYAGATVGLRFILRCGRLLLLYIGACAGTIVESKMYYW